MSQPTPTIDIDVSSLPAAGTPVADGLGGRLARMGIVYKAVRALVALANSAKSAADLTTGYLDPGRLEDGKTPLGKLAVAVATAEDLEAVRNLAQNAGQGGTTSTPRTITDSGTLLTTDVGSSVRARNTSAAVVSVPLLSATDGAMVSISRLGADVSVALAVPGTTLQRLRTAGGLKARALYSSLLLEAVRPPVPARPPLWAVVKGNQFTALTNGTSITSVLPDAASLVTLPAITPTGAQCPTVHRNAANGRTGIRFNGTTNVLPLTGAWLNLLRNRPNAVIFAVVLVTATGITGHRTLVSFMTGNTVQPSARAQLKWRDSGSGAAMALGRRLDSESGPAAANGSTATAPDFSVVSGRWLWSSSDVYALDNGVAIGSNTSFQTDGNTSDTASTAAAIGAAGLATAEFFSGTILEIGVGEYTSTVEAAYQAYAEAEYGEEWLVSGDTVA